LKYNEVIFAKNYIVFSYIFNVDNNTFGITSSDYITIFKIEEKQVKRISGINMDKINMNICTQLEFLGTEYIHII
jgi:hypothetical protein